MSRTTWIMLFGLLATISLIGCKQESATTTTTQETVIPPAAASALQASAADAIEVTVDAEGFHPANITIPAGKPSVVRFTRTVEKTCSTAVVFPGLDLRRDLPVGKPVEVTLTPEAPGTLNFACPMDMSKGTVTVTPAVEK